MAKYVKGIDVSAWEPFIDWDEVREQDIHFVFVKASQGRNRDFTFDRHWEDAKKFGFLRGAYHFIDPRVDGELQARVFLDRLKANGGLGPHDFPPVLDLEDFEDFDPDSGGEKGERGQPRGGGKGRKKGSKDKGAAKGKKVSSTLDASNSQVIRCVETWLAIVKEETKRTPIIYSRADYLKTRMIGPGGQRPSWSMDYPIWIAHYKPLPIDENVIVPNEADGWPPFTFWQYSDDGLMKGVYNDDRRTRQTEVDLSFFKGTLQELFAFVGAPVPDAIVAEVPQDGGVQGVEEVKVVMPVESATVETIIGTPVETPVEAPVAQAITYTIKPGDTIDGLAARFKTTRQAILAANPKITNPNFIRIGDTLTIPQA
jgi:GH25 family lysozyme M1 (1,4-beta-N-acetylmuramidase)